MSKILDINTKNEQVILEHFNGLIENVSFRMIPDDFADFLAPAQKVIELSYWLGIHTESAKQINDVEERS